MEAKSQRLIANGKQYDSLFPKANGSFETVKKGATLADTLHFIPKVVKDTRWQTEKIARRLKGSSVQDTCENIWNFVYGHIRYHKDEAGKEQIRSPGRTWHDRFRGVDCDCYSVFISTILTNLGIPHSLRIAKYRQDYFQHIYPIVPLKDGSHLTLDCVVDQFNYEEPFTEKKDTIMDLQYLDGLDDNFDEIEGVNMDEFFEDDQVGMISFPRKLPFKLPAKTSLKTAASTTKPRGLRAFVQKQGGLKELVKKGLNITNKINPGTIPLRNGFLAAMKLNIFRIAQRIKYGYLTEEQARQKGLDMTKWAKLVKAREKMENIFYTAGGKKENLKKAILSGRGNRNHDVSGLGYLPDENVLYMNENTPLPQLLGGIYYDEMEGVEGLGELGEAYTAASITAASGFLAAISGLIKSIGSVFPRKDQKGAQDFENVEADDAQAAAQGADAPLPDGADMLPAPVRSSSPGSPSGSSSNLMRILPQGDAAADTASYDIPADDGSGSGDNADAGFWEKNKKWLKPTLFGVGGLGLLFAGYKLITAKKAKPVAGKPLAGVKSKKKPAAKKPAAKTPAKRKKAPAKRRTKRQVVKLV